ncbi:unnamed protein product [Peniophora sp. CBMAI 1063]|nr:unnamed protein product [Peniophora sp. CBMAI 1063]
MSQIQQGSYNCISNSSQNVVAWERELRALSSLLVAARGQRNSCSMTCILPAEILSRVFACLKAEAPLLHSEDLGTRIGWLSVTQVCRHWRAVAKANASLWTDINVLSIPLWDLFTESSSNLPLSVFSCIGEKADRIPNYRKLIRGALPRVKELNAHAHRTGVPGSPGRRHLKSLLQALNSPSEPLRLLQKLELESDTYKTAGLTADFFNTHAIELRHVVLRQIAYPLGGISPRLQSLTLVKTNCSNAFLFFDTLRQLPCLEKLFLIQTLGIRSSAQSLSAVEMPHLRDLRIENEISQSVSIWRSLRVHPQAYVMVDASVATSCTDSHLHALAEATAAHLEDPGRPTFVYLDLSAYDYQPLCDFVMSTHIEDVSSNEEFTAQSSIHTYPCPCLKVVLPIFCDVPCHHIPNIYRKLFSNLLRKDWTAVQLSGHMHWQDELLISVFADARLVTDLSLREVPQDTVLELCYALGQNARGDKPVLFPALSALRFEAVNLGYVSQFPMAVLRRRPISRSRLRFAQAFLTNPSVVYKSSVALWTTKISQLGGSM